VDPAAALPAPAVPDVARALATGDELCDDPDAAADEA
jgi:hypothetical protein